MHEIDQELSDAIVHYVGYKTENSPNESIMRLSEKMGQRFVDENLQRINEVLTALNSVQIDWGVTSLQDGALKARSEIASKYPNLNGHALDALAWTYSWWWKWLFRQYADDIEVQTGYRLTPGQRDALATEMRTGEHAVTLSGAENVALRTEFNNARPAIIAEWSWQTGQAWPQVSVVINGQRVIQNAPAHHVIPVTNGGPAAWWNITPAAQPGHTALHTPGSPLNQLQTGAR